MVQAYVGMIHGEKMSAAKKKILALLKKAQASSLQARMAFILLEVNGVENAIEYISGLLNQRKAKQLELFDVRVP